MMKNHDSLIWLQMCCIACVTVGAHMLLISNQKNKNKTSTTKTCTTINRCLLFGAFPVHNSFRKSAKCWQDCLFIKSVIKRSMWKENLSLLLQRKGKEGKKNSWHQSIRSWWKGIPEICLDEIILNPKSLQISCLILTHSSQVIAVCGGTMCLHSCSVQVFVHEAQE